MRGAAHYCAASRPTAEVAAHNRVACARGGAAHVLNGGDFADTGGGRLRARSGGDFGEEPAAQRAHRRMSHPVFKPKPNAHSMCAQESSLHTYHTENGDIIANVSI
jgi:hypothetical protein